MVEVFADPVTDKAYTLLWLCWYADGNKLLLLPSDTVTKPIMCVCLGVSDLIFLVLYLICKLRFKGLH